MRTRQTAVRTHGQAGRAKHTTRRRRGEEEENKGQRKTHPDPGASRDSLVGHRQLALVLLLCTLLGPFHSLHPPLVLLGHFIPLLLHHHLLLRTFTHQMPLEFEFPRSSEQLSEAGFARDEVLFEFGTVRGGRVGDFGREEGQFGGGGGIGGGGCCFALAFTLPGSTGIERERERRRRRALLQQRRHVGLSDWTRASQNISV